jgi:putative membrane protein
LTQVKPAELPSHISVGRPLNLSKTAEKVPMKKLALTCAGAALLGACSTREPAPVAPVVAVDPNNPLMAPGYLAMAGSSDQFEIQSGQLALQMSQNPAVRNFGNMLVADHTRSTQMLIASAQSAGIAPPPPALLPQHQAMLDQLRAAGSGPSFDMAFQQAQVQAHQQALQLHQNYAASGDVPALRATAGQIVPVVQMHLQQVQAMNVAPPVLAPPPVRQSGERG